MAVLDTGVVAVDTTHPASILGLAVASSIKQTLHVAELSSLSVDPSVNAVGDLAWVTNVANRANMHRWNGARWVPEWLNVTITPAANNALSVFMSRIDWNGVITINVRTNTTVDINHTFLIGSVGGSYAPPSTTYGTAIVTNGGTQRYVQLGVTSGGSGELRVYTNAGNPIVAGMRTADYQVFYVVPGYATRSTD